MKSENFLGRKVKRAFDDSAVVSGREKLHENERKQASFRMLGRNIY